MGVKMRNVSMGLELNFAESARARLRSWKNSPKREARPSRIADLEMITPRPGKSSPLSFVSHRPALWMSQGSVAKSDAIS